MWQQMLMQAAANGNSTFNTALANSMSENSKKDMPKVGGKFTGQMGGAIGNIGGTVQGNEPAQQGGQAAQQAQGSQFSRIGGQLGGQAGAMIGGMSDDRTKEKTPTKDMIAEVAQMINNYTYHYKPGVGEDPSIEYSGPMAQELLQVDGYRSCVFEDEDGLLKVDTGRLALVNAGMIADVTKRLLVIEQFIESMMGAAQAPDVE